MVDDEPEVDTPELRARHALMAAAHQARLAQRRPRWTPESEDDGRDERTPDGPAA